MTIVKASDSELIAHAKRLQGKILLITGGGSGIGKAISMLFAEYGAKVVIGDTDSTSAQQTVEEINASGGVAVARSCDVTVWEEQIALFEFAKTTYGSVDVVIPAAELFVDDGLELKEQDGKLHPPDLKVIDVNLTGSLYTTSLALHHLVSDETDPTSLKALVFIGSVASIRPFYPNLQYSASKAGIRGLQAAVPSYARKQGVRTGSVFPWFTSSFASQTNRQWLSELPLVDPKRVAAVCLAIATNPDPATNGRPWLVLAGENAQRLHYEIFDESIFRELNSHAKAHEDVTASEGSDQAANPASHVIHYSDEELIAHGDRIRGCVFLITGAGSGIGKTVALKFAHYGANVVIGDINPATAQETVDEIRRAGGHAISQKCDVTNWEDQVSLFELAATTFGTVDIVMPNAGVANEPYELSLLPQVKDGKLLAPNLLTMEVNLTGVLWTTALALRYLPSEASTGRSDRLKAIIFIASIIALLSFPTKPMYATSKSAVLGVQQSLAPLLKGLGIRNGAVLPAYVDTNLVRGLEDYDSKWPMVPVERVAAACMAVASIPDPVSSGAPWLLPLGANGGVQRLQYMSLSEGLWGEYEKRGLELLPEIMRYQAAMSRM
ncbi:NAD(P)-binding protein [Trametopsis cervina]|nr:NAD(P)-binding protein [Trametopsis cervina]